MPMYLFSIYGYRILSKRQNKIKATITEIIVKLYNLNTIEYISKAKENLCTALCTRTIFTASDELAQRVSLITSTVQGGAGRVCERALNLLIFLRRLPPSTLLSGCYSPHGGDHTAACGLSSDSSSLRFQLKESAGQILLVSGTHITAC